MLMPDYSRSWFVEEWIAGCWFVRLVCETQADADRAAESWRSRGKVVRVVKAI